MRVSLRVSRLHGTIIDTVSHRMIHRTPQSMYGIIVELVSIEIVSIG